MPNQANSLPTFSQKFHAEYQNSQESDEETNFVREQRENINDERENEQNMNSQKTEIEVLLREKGPEILAFLHQKQGEKGITNADLMMLSQIPNTSFYRIWNGDGTKMNSDHICRICFVLGVSMDEFQREPTGESTVRLPGLREDSHEEIMDNILSEYNRQKEIIQTLTNDNSRKSDRIVELDRELKRRIDENGELQKSYTDRIAVLTDALIERHDQMHQLSREHTERIDKLDAALRARYDQLHELFTGLLNGKYRQLLEKFDEDKED